MTIREQLVAKMQALDVQLETLYTAVGRAWFSPGDKSAMFRFAADRAAMARNVREALRAAIEQIDALEVPESDAN